MIENLSFKNWAIVGLNDDTGAGRMVRDARQVLEIGYHLVITSERFFTRPIDYATEISFGSELSDESVKSLIRQFDGLFLIYSYYHPRLLLLARGLKVKTICVPMWEWFNLQDPQWQFCDLFVCPNRFCHNLLQRAGFKNSIILPTSLNLSTLPKRVISGPARVFIHNAGWVDWDDRKGTKDVIRAFQRIHRRDVRLLVRLQKEVPLVDYSGDERIEVRIGNLSDPRELYIEGDVAVQPSKMEGIGFMVLEPVCCGIPTITLNYGPMNEYVRQVNLLVSKWPFKRRAHATQWFKQAHLRLPISMSLTRRMEWCIDNNLEQISLFNRNWAEQTFGLLHLRALWSQALRAV